MRHFAQQNASLAPLLKEHVDFASMHSAVPSCARSDTGIWARYRFGMWAQLKSYLQLNMLLQARMCILAPFTQPCPTLT